jgi:preprotein translocase subunit SecG
MCSTMCERYSLLRLAMDIYLHISQILIAVLIVVVVLLQVRGVGSGLFGSAEGGFRTRRGMERTLFRFTIMLGVLFVLLGILSFRYT